MCRLVGDFAGCTCLEENASAQMVLYGISFCCTTSDLGLLLLMLGIGAGQGDESVLFNKAPFYL